MENLPVEIIEMIVKNLEFNDLKSISCASRIFYHVATSPLMWKRFVLFSDDPETFLRALSLPRLVYMEKIHVANISASHMNIDLVKNLFCKIGKHSCREISWENCDLTFVSTREVSKVLFQKKVLAFKDTKF